MDRHSDWYDHAAPHWRADDLVLVRESAAGKDQLEAMAKEAHRSASRVPGIDALQAAGIEPLYEPEKYDAELYTGPQSRLVVFPVAGTDQKTWQVLAVASAAKTDERQVQWFSEVFVSILAQLRPINVHFPSAGRGFRDTLAGNRTLRALEEHVDTLWLGGTPFQIGGDDPSGAMSLGFLVQFAASERNELVRRNLNGKVAAVGERHRFIDGPAAVPLGYRLGRGRRLEPDPAAGGLLELACRLLADPAAAPVDVRESMRRAGVVPPGDAGDGSWTFDPEGVAAELAALTAGAPPA